MKYSRTDLLEDLNADDPSLKREIKCDGSSKNFLSMIKKFSFLSILWPIMEIMYLKTYSLVISKSF